MIRLEGNWASLHSGAGGRTLADCNFSRLMGKRGNGSEIESKKWKCADRALV